MRHYLCPLEVTEVALHHLICMANSAAVLGPRNMDRLGRTRREDAAR